MGTRGNNILLQISLNLIGFTASNLFPVSAEDILSTRSG